MLLVFQTVPGAPAATTVVEEVVEHVGQDINATDLSVCTSVNPTAQAEIVAVTDVEARVEPVLGISSVPRQDSVKARVLKTAAQERFVVLDLDLPAAAMGCVDRVARRLASRPVRTAAVIAVSQQNAALMDTAGQAVRRIGLGCMNVAWGYGELLLRDDAVKLFRHALDTPRAWRN